MGEMFKMNNSHRANMEEILKLMAAEISTEDQSCLWLLSENWYLLQLVNILFFFQKLATGFNFS